MPFASAIRRTWTPSDELAPQAAHRLEERRPAPRPSRATSPSSRHHLRRARPARRRGCESARRRIAGTRAARARLRARRHTGAAARFVPAARAAARGGGGGGRRRHDEVDATRGAPRSHAPPRARHRRSTEAAGAAPVARVSPARTTEAPICTAAQARSACAALETIPSGKPRRKRRDEPKLSRACALVCGVRGGSARDGVRLGDRVGTRSIFMFGRTLKLEKAKVHLRTTSYN